MLGFIFRLFFTLLAIAVLGLLFVYALVAAAIITPFLAIFLYFLNRKAKARWQELQREQARYRSPDGQPGPVIDHDPNDLPRT